MLTLKESNQRFAWAMVTLLFSWVLIACVWIIACERHKKAEASEPAQPPQEHYTDDLDDRPYEGEEEEEDAPTDPVDVILEALPRIAEFHGEEWPNVRRGLRESPRTIVEEIVEASDRAGIDPMLFTLVLFNESRLRSYVVGGDGEWCGIGQINRCDKEDADLEECGAHWPRRPTCEQAMCMRTNVQWAARLIASFAQRPECDGSPCLMYYWGEGERAGRNERRMWRRLNTLRQEGYWQ